MNEVEKKFWSTVPFLDDYLPGFVNPDWPGRTW